MTKHTNSLRDIPLFRAFSMVEINILGDYLSYQNFAACEVVFHTDNLDAI